MNAHALAEAARAVCDCITVCLTERQQQAINDLRQAIATYDEEWETWQREARDRAEDPCIEEDSQ